MGQSSWSQDENISRLWMHVSRLRLHFESPEGSSTQHLLVVCRVLSAKMLGATSSDGFLVKHEYKLAMFH